MKKIYILIFSVFLVGFVSASCNQVFSRGCSPSSGYDYCSEVSWNCGGAVSYAKVQISDVQTDGEQHGQYSTGDTYIDFNLVGDTGYFNENINSNNWWDNNCNDYGCAGSDMWGADSIKLTNNPGDHYTDCPMFYAFDRADSGGYYSNSISAWGWLGSGNCFDIRQVECYDNSDCSGNFVCDKSGSWSTWSCVEEEEECPATLNYNSALPKEVNGCAIWQNFQQYSHCNGGWFIYNPDGPSSLQMSEGQYRSIAPNSCWEEECVEDWECSGWATCTGQQSRSCVDNNDCGTINSRPELIQDCDIDCPATLNYNSNLSVDVVDCVVWQNFNEFSDCNGGWFLYNPDGPSSLIISETEYQSVSPESCWAEEGGENGETTENIWEKVWFTKAGIDFTFPILLTSFAILVFVLRFLRQRK